MIRFTAVVAVVVCLSPSWLNAQNPKFTIGSEPAEVHKSPSTGSPVIGKAARGTVLDVTRELGSWVKISWPAAPDGVGYVHVSMGTFGNSSLPASRPTARPTTTSITGQPAPEVPPAVAPGVQGQRTGAVAQSSPVSSVPIPHLVGLGGRMGSSTLGSGASARGSVGRRFRVQLEASRYGLTSAVTQRRLTSVQFAPSLLYSLPDKVTDYVWVRPYVGSGVTVYRSTSSSATSAAGNSVADSRLGRQVFGGAEVALASVPRFTLSADFGYRWSQTPFDGFELGGKGLSVSGHWYVK